MMKTLAKLFFAICLLGNFNYLYAYISTYPWRQDWRYVQPKVYSGPYLEGFGGYGFLDWRNFNAGGRFADPAAFNREHLEGGLVGGVDFGYQYNQYTAIEGGWLSLPLAKATIGVDIFTAHTWAAYFAGKIIAPIWGRVLADRLFLYAKMGGVFRSTYIQNDTSGSWIPGVQNLPIKAGYWAPLMGVGIQYYLNWNWSISVQYVRLPGYFHPVSIDQERKMQTPDADLLTLAIMFKLPI